MLRKEGACFSGMHGETASLSNSYSSDAQGIIVRRRENTEPIDLNCSNIDGRLPKLHFPAQTSCTPLHGAVIDVVSIRDYLIRKAPHIDQTSHLLRIRFELFQHQELMMSYSDMFCSPCYLLLVPTPSHGSTLNEINTRIHQDLSELLISQLSAVAFLVRLVSLIIESMEGEM